MSNPKELEEAARAFFSSELRLALYETTEGPDEWEATLRDDRKPRCLAAIRGYHETEDGVSLREVLKKSLTAAQTEINSVLEEVGIALDSGDYDLEALINEALGSDSA